MNPESTRRVVKAGLLLLCAGMAQPETAARQSPTAERIYRGEAIAEYNDYRSFILPLDGQRGLPLDPLGDNSESYGGATPWWAQTDRSIRYHYNDADFGVVYFPWTVAFENPMAAYGELGGGDRLLTGRSYHFGVYCGHGIDGGGEFDNQLRILVYERDDFTPGASHVTPIDTLSFAVPDKQDPGEWQQWVDAGFSAALEGYGLKTTIRLVELHPENNPFGVPLERHQSPYVLQHVANSGATNYFFVVEGSGGINLGSYYPLVNETDQPVISPQWNTLYALDFSPSAAWRSSILDANHFQGEPLPAAYYGKTHDELLADLPPVELPVGLAAIDCLQLDHSPQLKRHPVLDQFVADMGADPLALATYVVNEIESVDLLAYNTNPEGSVGDATLNGGGISRDALGVYMERQGSPAEQCALLVYLLREAAVPACYMQPEYGRLSLTDRQAGSLLRTRIEGAVDSEGVSNVPAEINVDYPWVAVFVDGSWRHLFPWLKDYEVIEGKALFDHLPDGYRTGHQIVHKFLTNDAELFGELPTHRPFAPVFDDFLRRSLQTHYPDVSVDQLGVVTRMRRHFPESWDEFRRPWEVGGSPVAFESYADDEDIFDTVTHAFTVRNGDGSTVYTTGELRLCDLHNRRITFHHEKTGADTHDLVVALMPYRAGDVPGGVGSLSAPDADLLRCHELRIPLGVDAEDVELETTFNYLRKFTGGDPVAGEFLGLRLFNTLVNEALIRRGDSGALAYNYGRVTQRMMDAHVREFNAHQASLLGEQFPEPEREVCEGIPSYLMLQSQFRTAGEATRKLAGLQKLSPISVKAGGLARFCARLIDGQLPNQGEIDPVTPSLDVYSQVAAYVGNQSIHQESGDELSHVMLDYFPLELLASGSEEHAQINRMFSHVDGVSAIRLLQLANERFTAGLTADDIVSLDFQNYSEVGEDWLWQADWSFWLATEEYFSGNPNQLLLSHRKGYVTPGHVASPSGNYAGLGGFYIGEDGEGLAIIRSELLQNGGRSGSSLPDNYFHDVRLNLRYDEIGRASCRERVSFTV